MSTRDNARIRSSSEEMEIQMAVDKIDSDHDRESTVNEPYDTQAAVSRHRGWPNASDPTRWPLYTLRYELREYFAEFFGTMILITFGNGVVATTTFGAGDSPETQSNASYLAITFGWGIGLTIALYVSMGISGGSLNPAVTLANCFFGTFPWRKAPGFILAQLLGAMVGAANVYGLFKDHFDKVELAPGETMTDAVGGIFCTYPNVSTGSAVWSEILNSMLLMMGILGLINEKMTPAVNHRPIAVGLLVFAIGIASGWNSGYAINPARDLGPRIVSSMIFRSSDPFTKADHYFWVPMLMPIVGTTLGFFLFTVFILPLRD